MIKINLLLARKEKKKAGLRKEYIVLIASVVLLIVGLGVIQYLLGREKEDTLSKINDTKKEIAYYNL
jgi:flagellar basal body-associated protein FliL